MIKTKDRKIFNIIGYILIILFCISCILPFYLILAGSLTSESTIVTRGYSFFVRLKDIAMEAYRIAIGSPDTIAHAYLVTIFVTVFGTFISVFITAMTGYVLSRKDFPWRNQISFIFFFTTLFNGGLVPYYIICTRYLNFTNNIISLILPGLLSVWNIIIAKTFMANVPFELIEAAKIDGAGDFYIFIRVVLPISMPLIATLTLFTALAYWNDWYNCMLFMSNGDMWNLQYTLQNTLNSSEVLHHIASDTGRKVGEIPYESLKLAMTVITTGPIVLLYPFLQKYFIKGLTIGGVKG